MIELPVVVTAFLLLLLMKLIMAQGLQTAASSIGPSTSTFGASISATSGLRHPFQFPCSSVDACADSVLGNSGRLRRGPNLRQIRRTEADGHRRRYFCKAEPLPRCAGEALIATLPEPFEPVISTVAFFYIDQVIRGCKALAETGGNSGKAFAERRLLANTIATSLGVQFIC